MSSSIENELIEIKKMQKVLSEKIENLEKIIKKQEKTVLYNKKNKDLFIYYLNNKGIKDSSINSYISGLEKIRMLFAEYNIITLHNEIYYIDDISYLNSLVEAFNNSADIILINLKHHHMYSAALNNYANFLKIIK